MTKFAYRIETRKVKEADFPYSAVQMTSPEAVAGFARSLEDADVEKFIVLYLNTKNKLIGIKINSGTIDRQVIWPREIIKEAILSGAQSLVLIHNHPSGDPSASQEDIALTKTIIDAATLMDIRVLDHVIIGEAGKYISMTERGLMQQVTRTGQITMSLGR